MAIRTDNTSIQTLMAQAQSRLAAGTSSTDKAKSDSATSTSTAAGATTQTDQVKTQDASLDKAHERIAAQAKAASTSLSALGQFKSSLVDLGASGKEMVALSSTSTTQSVQAAVEKFVARYNANLSKGVAAAGSANDTSVSRTMRDLRSAVNGPATDTGVGTDQPTLAKLGITRKPDGTLVLDTKALAKSMETNATGTAAALVRAGKAVVTSTSTALDSDSRLSNTITSTGNRAKLLEQQEAAVISTATRLSQAYGLSSAWNQQVLNAYLKN